MDDALHAKVLFFPSEVMVVFNIEDHFCAQVFCDMAMNQRGIGSGIFAHEFHCRPVFAAIHVIEG